MRGIDRTDAPRLDAESRPEKRNKPIDLLTNPYRTGAAFPGLDGIPAPLADPAPPVALLAQCPAAAETPLRDVPDLAGELGVARISVKDERGRMGLGSFKALGAAYVIACAAMARNPEDPTNALQGTTYVTASAGNHGMSVAAGAAVFGAQAVVYIAQTVPESFAARLRAKGAQVVREGAIYEDSMAAAEAAAQANGWQLLSDSSWPGYTEMPLRLMEGYLAMMAEVFAQIPAPPTHIFLQAGVGGLAGAAAASARAKWGDDPLIVVVEPDFARALQGSIRAGAVTTTDGPESAMGRLDCKTPSLIALKGLAADADLFATISEEEAEAALRPLADLGLASTPSGAAGLAALLAAGPAGTRDALRLDAGSHILAILSEGPEA